MQNPRFVIMFTSSDLIYWQMWLWLFLYGIWTILSPVLNLTFSSKSFLPYQNYILWFQFGTTDVPVIFYFLGLFVCTLQAFIFTVLSMVYVSLAVSHDH